MKKDAQQRINDAHERSIEAHTKMIAHLFGQLTALQFKVKELEDNKKDKYYPNIGWAPR